MDVYGSRFTSIYINTNGLITFSSVQASYTPAALTTLGQPSLAPFWTDIDVTTGKITIAWLNVVLIPASPQTAFRR